jgi:hypothetical protein
MGAPTVRAHAATSAVPGGPVAVKQDAARRPRPFALELPPRVGGADEPDEQAVRRTIVNAALVAICLQFRHLLI